MYVSRTRKKHEPRLCKSSCFTRVFYSSFSRSFDVKKARVKPVFWSRKIHESRTRVKTRSRLCKSSCFTRVFHTSFSRSSGVKNASKTCVLHGPMFMGVASTNVGITNLKMQLTKCNSLKCLPKLFLSFLNKFKIVFNKSEMTILLSI